MQLRDYQIEDKDKLVHLKVAGCFNEQRTGKTPTTISALTELGAKKILVVCPASAIPQWAEEFERWSEYKPTKVLGTKKQKEKLVSAWTEVLIISYDTFKETKRSEGFIKDILNQKPDAVVIDEAHRIKDPKSANAKAVFKLTKVPIRFALTGTPAPGKPEEVFSLLHFLDPSTFTSYWGFIDRFFVKVAQMNYSAQKQYFEIAGFQPGKQYYLQSILNKLATMRKRKDVMPWLPEKDYQPIKLEPTKEQLKHLNELKKYYETEHIITKGTLDRLIRYRQLCLHPQLLGLRSTSPKVDWLKDFIRDYPDKPVLIFSKFTSFLKLVAVELKLGGSLIIGDTPIEERNMLVKAFQNGEINVLLINIDAGKEALTLDRAEAAIFTDKYPPIGDIQQAEDRFVSTSEDKKDKPHTIYELMIKGTYDEEIHKLLQKRATAVDIVNNFKKYLGG